MTPEKAQERIAALTAENAELRVQVTRQQGTIDNLKWCVSAARRALGGG